MKKNFFIILVGLMLSSLLAIILVQVYWTYSAWKDKEEEFSLSVMQSLNKVSSQIQDRELSDYINAFERLVKIIPVETS